MIDEERVGTSALWHGDRRPPHARSNVGGTLQRASDAKLTGDQSETSPGSTKTALRRAGSAQVPPQLRSTLRALAQRPHCEPH